MQHYRWLNMRDVTFAVQLAGRAKVLKERRKNVHAFVRGLVDSSQLLESNDWNCKPCDMNTLERFYDEVRYQPYLYESFVYKDSEEPIFETPHALIMGRRIFCRREGWSTMPPSTPITTLSHRRCGPVDQEGPEETQRQTGRAARVSPSDLFTA